MLHLPAEPSFSTGRTPANAFIEQNQNNMCPDKEDLPSETTYVTSAYGYNVGLLKTA